MGRSRNRAELQSKLRRAESQVASNRPLRAATDAVKRTMEGTAARAGLRRGSKIAGSPWRGVYVRRAGRGMAVGYARPAHLVNNRTRPHIVGAKGLGTRKTITRRVTAATVVSALSGSAVSASFRGRQGAKALTIGGDFAAYARHPGTRGKRFFEAAKGAAARNGARSAQGAFAAGFASIFR